MTLYLNSFYCPYNTHKIHSVSPAQCSKVISHTDSVQQCQKQCTILCSIQDRNINRTYNYATNGKHYIRKNTKKTKTKKNRVPEIRTHTSFVTCVSCVFSSSFTILYQYQTVDVCMNLNLKQVCVFTGAKCVCKMKKLL